MGWHSDSIGYGSNQWEWFGHCNWRGCWNEFNSDDYYDTDWVYHWLGNSYGNVLSQMS